MEVALRQGVVVATHTSRQVFLHLQSTMDNQCTLGLDEFCIVTEALQISLLGAIDVQMVGVCRGDNRHIGRQPVEGAVELIGLDDNEIGVGEDVVRAVVLRNASQEGVAVQMALVHDMSTHGAGSGLAVRTSHTESLMLACQRSQHLGTLLDVEAVVAEELQFLMFGRDSRGIDDQTRLRLAAGSGNGIDILFVMDEHTLRLQLTRQRAGSLVVASHDKAFLEEVASDGTHSDASGSYKIDCFYIFNIQHGNNGINGINGNDGVVLRGRGLPWR